MFLFSKVDKVNINPGSIEEAYLKILEEDLQAACAIFETIDSPRAHWGLVFVEILLGYIKKYPTYFEIRNFLEIDLDFLLKNGKTDFVEQVLGSLYLLVTINHESYKYVARVMFENRLYKATREFLDKSKDVYYNDPELHFMYAKYYIKTREYEFADFHLDECLNILPDYYPAITLQKDISRYLA